MNYLLASVGASCIDKTICGYAWLVIAVLVIILMVIILVIRIINPDLIFMPEEKELQRRKRKKKA
jgi:hypothetical protein